MEINWLKEQKKTYEEYSQTILGEIRKTQEENQELSQKIDALGTKDSTRRIATEELGLVDPDAQFFVPGN